ncbi:MAG: SpoIIE family protein phosphatase, partial [Bacteroidales bacterium]|nr:SpoIIE family protein phosphatase [Bacteroidales bacterium]
NAKSHKVLQKLVNEHGGISSNNLHALAEYQGGMFMGHFLTGIDRYDMKTGKIKNYRLNPDFKAPPMFNSSFGLFVDSEDILWVAGRFSLNYYDPKKDQFPRFKEKQTIRNFVYDINEDKDKNLWMALRHGGFYKYDRANDTIIRFHPGNSRNKGMIANEYVCVYIDSQNRKWFGSKTHGLMWYDETNDTLIYYDKKHGLPDNSVYGILEDDKGNLWFGTDKGLVSFNTSTKRAITYDIEDGLSEIQFNYSSAYKGKDGCMYFGHVNGLTYFYPDKIMKNEHPPEVLLADFKLFGKTVKPNDETGILKQTINKTQQVVLNHKQKIFTIDYVALNYLNPGRNTFYFYLEGLENNWNKGSNQTSVTYTNLDDGNYVFHLKAINNDGVESKVVKNLYIKVLPPWWQTLWFKIGTILTIIILLFTFYKMRVRVLTERQRVLEQTVNERTKELRSANENLQEQKEEILTQNEEIQQQAEELATQRDALSEQNEEIVTKNEQISKSFKNTQMLSELGKKITSELDVLAIFDIIYNYVNSIVRISSFGIGIYNKQNNIINFDAFKNKGEDVKSFNRSMNQEDSFSVWVINNQKPVFINDMVNEYNNYLKGKPAVVGENNVQSTILMPLSTKGKKLGVLVLDSDMKNAFTENDFNNIQNLASYISIALDNVDAYSTIHNINKGMKESITYAKSIQSAFLPSNEDLNKYFESMVFFRPKDIVSGDFYWFSSIGDSTEKSLKVFLCVADCTGHGVPGALVSSIGNNLLERYINIIGLRDPAQILNQVNDGFQKALNQSETGNNDGMDMALCYIEEIGENTSANATLEDSKNTQMNQPCGKYRVTFAGAKNSIAIFRAQNGELEHLKGSRKSIGGLRAARSKMKFENNEIIVDNGDLLYMFTDGIIDQHSVDRERFTGVQLLEQLKKMGRININEQEKYINSILKKHQQNEKQTDDITLVGIKF